MGLWDRDYMRRRSGGTFDLGELGTKKWLGVAVVVIAAAGWLTTSLVRGSSPFGKGGWFRSHRQVDINRASVAQIDALPSVSTAVAEAIVSSRPFTNVDELIRVYGIGPKTLERIRPHVKVE